MKQFFKYMMATICGIIVLSIVGVIILAVIISGLVASGNKSVTAKENSVFVLKMEGVVSERAEDAGPFGNIFGMTIGEMGLDDIISAINKAKEEKNIKGIYLESGIVEFDSPATAQQVRDALESFKKSGKWIVAYADQYLQTAYYVSSVANEVYLNQTGMLDFRGIGGKSYYLKGLYDKVGVKYQAARVGRYKSYVESVTRTDMSDDDREQRQAYVNGIWNHWISSIATSRKLVADSLNKLADDSIMVFANADTYVNAGLVDKLMYPEEVKSIIKKKLKVDEKDELNLLSLNDMTNLKVKGKKEKGDEIAVYYAYGEIVDEMLNGLGSGHAIVGKQTVDDLNKLANDDNVKAVVLRVNSGGGSAVASQQIWHAIKQLKAKKPVVVSMGGAAASGGYMISCGASYIFAEPTTITGSIGIFGLVPNASELVTQKLGVTWDGVMTNKFTDYDNDLIFGSDNSDALKYLQSYTDRGYEQFLSIVAEGRGMTKDQVHQIAQGRVWLASDAIGIKLVDKLGSLDDAVKKAAELAKMKEYHTAAYPAKVDWFDRLFADEETLSDSYLDGRLRATLGELYEPLMQAITDQQRNRLQARLPFSLKVK